MVANALLSLMAVFGGAAPAAGPSEAPNEPPPWRLTWSDNMLVIRSPRLPGGKLEIWYLEAFCRKGSTDREWSETTIPHRTELVEAAKDDRMLRLRSVVEPGVVVDHVLRAETHGVDFRLSATNPTDEAVDIEWAQPCIRVEEFTGLDQEAYIRKCFIFLDKGLTTLDNTRRVEEARYRGGQVYVPEGIDHEDVNPRPISPDVPVNGLMGCFSHDDSMLLAMAWDKTQELFQGVIVCIHSDFRIGGLAPGETRRLHGKLYLLKNDPRALLERYRNDFCAAE